MEGSAGATDTVFLAKSCNHVIIAFKSAVDIVVTCTIPQLIIKTHDNLAKITPTEELQLGFCSLYRQDSDQQHKFSVQG